MKTIFKSYILALFVILGFLYVNGQTVSKATKQKIALADQLYVDLKFSRAAPLYEELVKVSSDPEVMLKKLADCYWQMRNYPQALRVYMQLYPRGKGGSSSLEQFRIGELYARSNDYQQASQWLEGVEGYTAKSKAYGSINSSSYGDTLSWKIGYLDLNTVYREYSPMVHNDTLFFSSNRPLELKKKSFGWDGESYSRLWQVPVSSLTISGVEPSQEQSKVNNAQKQATFKSKRLAGIYEGSDVLISPKTQVNYSNSLYVKATSSFYGKPVEGLNRLKYNIGGECADSLNTLYFSANYPKANKQGDNRIRILSGHYTKSGISDIKEFPFGDPESYSVMHPAVNPGGTVLVFSSDKKSGIGQFDLYCCIRSDNKQNWGSPQLLGDNINTKGNEVFPSVTSDGYLYYSSDDKAGLGGLDIYRIKLQDALLGKSTPEHLPYPVNSSSDDFGWSQTSDGKQFYFTSDRVSSEDNIYTASYKYQPRVLEGFVLDRQTMAPMEDATVFLLNKCNNKVYVAKTNDKGKYTYSANGPCEVVILGTNKGFSNDCLSMLMNDRNATQLVQKAPHDLLLDKYTVGLKWRVNNIHYDFDKWDIRADARPILDSLVDLLKTYPIKVELGSHTDSRGSFEYNDELSQHRAESAVAYIVSRGIDPSRITAKGYGEHQLLNRCSDGVPCSVEEHQANRRTEVKVIGGPESVLPSTFDPSVYKDGQELEQKDLPANFFDNCGKVTKKNKSSVDDSNATDNTHRLEGFVRDRQTLQPIGDATVFLLNGCDNTVYVTKTNTQGKFSYPVNESCKVVILATTKGSTKDCLSMKTDVDNTQSTVENTPRDLLLDKFTVGYKWKVNNIHYDFDKWNIRSDARPILDSLVDLLKSYPIEVELGSHTDCRGSFEYNDRLSQRRAESAVSYIVSKGIPSSRITAKGYGEHQLLNRCSDGVPCSPAEHQANRRTEVKVIGGVKSNLPSGFDPSIYKDGQQFRASALPDNFFEDCR